MTLLECVTRILRSSAIIRGDTDVPTSFSDTQHNASMNVAIVAVQNELVRLTAERLLAKERLSSGTITLTTNTRVYSLPAGFIRFYGTPHFRTTDNRQVYMYDGGLDLLQTNIFNYSTQYGSPNWWYWEPSSALVKQIGFFQVPSSVENGQVWAFDYETSVMVSLAADVMPFHNDEENFSFSEMAGRRFKYMFEDIKNELDIQNVLDRDGTYRSAKATLYKLLRGVNPIPYYGRRYW